MFKKIIQFFKYVEPVKPTGRWKIDPKYTHKKIDFSNHDHCACPLQKFTEKENTPRRYDMGGGWELVDLTKEPEEPEQPIKPLIIDENHFDIKYNYFTGTLTICKISKK
jgi:hypothetical protein